MARHRNIAPQEFGIGRRGSLIVKTKTYTAEYEPLAKGVLFMRRNVTHDAVDRDTDVFGKSWAFSTAVLDAGQVSAKRGRKLVELPEGPIALFVPPFSVIEWEIGAGSFSFDSILSSTPLPEDMPKEPMLFSIGDSAFPKTVADVIALVRSAHDFHPIGRAENPDALSRRVKTAIDLTYAEPIPMSEIARRLGLSHTVMGRAFKKAFGLSPVAYRNKLRVTDSLRLILMENSRITAAAFGIGFEDLSRYYRLFRRQLNTCPSDYRPKKL